MSPGGGAAICDAQAKFWPRPELSANVTPHRQQQRRRERFVATINSCPASYDESTARLLPPAILVDRPENATGRLQAGLGPKRDGQSARVALSPASPAPGIIPTCGAAG